MSSASGLSILVCLFLSMIGEAEGAVSSPPSNTVAEVNGEAIFNCSATPSGPLLWVLTRDGISGVGDIRIASSCIVNAGLQDHYRTEQPGGQTTCNLIIFNITMEQAGVYHCTDSDTYRALLTVLDSSPGITYNNTPDVIEGENVVITCNLSYNGSVEPAPTLRPHFYWTDNTGNTVSSFYDSTPVNSPVVSQLSVTAGRKDIMPYTCHVYLKLIPTTTPMYASNTPSVTNSASSPTITVLYYPGNISIASSVSPNDECVQKQESLTCTADAKPPAQYEWLDLNSNTISQGSIKYITSGGQYQCIAYNYLRNIRYTDTKTTTEANCYPVTENNMTISGSGCTKDSCPCIENQPFELTCQVYSVPKATYRWWFDDQEYSTNQTITVTYDGNYNCTASNSFGTNSSEATVSTRVYNCTSPPPWIFVPVYFGVGWIFGLCFLIHYNVSKQKATYNIRFPVLMKMLPCLNKDSSAEASLQTAPSTTASTTTSADSNADSGNVGWIILYIVMVTFVGIFAIPIMFFTVQCSKSNKKGQNAITTENGEITAGDQHQNNNEDINFEGYQELTPTTKQANSYAQLTDLDPKKTESAESKETADTESSEELANKSVLKQNDNGNSSLGTKHVDMHL